MKAKTRSDVPVDVKTLRERNQALVEKGEALEERDTALREKEKIAGTLATMQVSSIVVTHELSTFFLVYLVNLHASVDIIIIIICFCQYFHGI